MQALATRPVRFALAAAVVVGIAALVAVGCGSRGGGVGKDTACVVDGIKVSQEAWKLALGEARNTEKVRSGKAPKADSKAGRALRAQVASTLVRWAAFQAEADERDVELGEGAVEKAWKEAVERSGGKAKAFRSQLELEGRTEAGFRADLERQILIQAVIDDARGSSEPSKEALERYLRENAGSFGGTPAQREVVQVIITIGGATSKAKDDAAAKKIAEEIAAAASAGGRDAMEKQARTRSDDPTYGPKGGALQLEQGSFSDEISDAVFDADAGDVVGPLRSPIGWHVLLVAGEVVEAEVPKLESVREQVERAAADSAAIAAEQELQDAVNERVEGAECRSGYLDAPEDEQPAPEPKSEPVVKPEPKADGEAAGSGGAQG